MTDMERTQVSNTTESGRDREEREEGKGKRKRSNADTNFCTRKGSQTPHDVGSTDGGMIQSRIEGQRLCF